MNVNELGLHQWYEIIDQLSDLNCCRVTLLGGEPLLYPYLSWIIHRIRSKGMACVVGSNGIFVPDKIDIIAEANTLVLSLDAAGPEHDRIRGPGAWERVNKALVAAQEQGINVKINAVLSSETLSSLERLLTFARKNKIGITINFMRSGNRSLWKNASEFKPDNAVIQKAFKSLSEYSRQNRFLLFPPRIYNIAGSWPDFAVDCVDKQDSDDFINSWIGPKCQAGRYFMSILPDGSASPCPIRIGSNDTANVMEGGVEEAWTALHDHSCVACYSPCLLALNSLLSFDMDALLHFFVRHVPRFT